jgi:general secretion pathway protein A
LNLRTAYASAAGLMAGVLLFALVSWTTRDGGAGQHAAVVQPAMAGAASGAASGASGSERTVASTAPAPASAVSLDAGLRSETEAWRELASLWKVSLADAEPCAAAAEQQLQCFKSDDGGLALIRGLSRPGVLTLYDSDGKAAYALLVALGPDSASLRVAGGGLQTVSLAALAKSWRGEFATLWRTPPAYEKLAVGQSGPMVDWLAAQLARASGEPAPTGPRALDAALREKVASFQLARGLKPDGRVGPMTLMQLNRVAGVDEPRLQAPVASN